jgi:hypothetical protein
MVRSGLPRLFEASVRRWPGEDSGREQKGMGKKKGVARMILETKLVVEVKARPGQLRDYGPFNYVILT